MNTKIKAGLAAAAFALSALVMPVQSLAQGPLGPGDVTIDFRESMRQWVQAISAYGRSLNPNFIVIAENGLDLVSKPDPQDDTLLFPAQAYIRAIDGVLQPNLTRTLQSADPKEDPAVTTARNRLIANAATAKAMGVDILNLEFSTKPDEIDKLYAASAQQGFTPFVAASPVLGRIPAHPRAAYNANPTSLSDPTQAKNFLYIAHSQGFGVTRDFVQALSGTNHDIVITGVFHGRAPLSKLDVERLKYKKLGARRLVLAELDISTAATYDYFWQPDWTKGSPAFIDLAVREDPDRHRTHYWDPAWQSVLVGGTASYLYGIFDLGFDGVVLKGVDGWRYYESGGEEQ
ncbi:hypothetical protein [Magnetovibrio sp.]|uniref:hypothetical protein n=1 Tax=Magnetovibrio sp. TaxID=2024836 RepID=UPI002F95452C